MIESLARSLAVALPNCTAEDITDLLLCLSTQPAPPLGGARLNSSEFRQSTIPQRIHWRTGWPHPGAKLRGYRTLRSVSGTVAAITKTSQAPGSSDNPLATAPVLGSFKRITRPGPPAVDVDATVEATADAGRLTVVTTSVRERGMDVAVIADMSLVMTACQSLVTELVNLLHRSNVFRSVSNWSLVPGTLLLRDSKGLEHNPANLADPWGRRLILVVTDAIADHWYAPGIWQLIKNWAGQMPTTVLYVLPAQYRAWSALGESDLTIRYRGPCEPNSSARVQHSWWNVDEPGREVPVPVVELTASALATWARAIASGNTPVAGISARQPSGESPQQANAHFTDGDRVRAFLARASPGARDLARLLARAPHLSWPLMTVLQAELLPSTGPKQLAEVLAGGLLVRVSQESEDGQPDLFNFRPGTTELLSRGTTVTQLWDTLDQVSAYLDKHANPGRDIRTLITSPFGITEFEDDLKPFAALGHMTAIRLGLAPAGSIPLASDATSRTIWPSGSGTGQAKFPAAVTRVPTGSRASMYCVKCRSKRERHLPGKGHNEERQAST